MAGSSSPLSSSSTVLSDTFVRTAVFVTVLDGVTGRSVLDTAATLMKSTVSEPVTTASCSSAVTWKVTCRDSPGLIVPSAHDSPVTTSPSLISVTSQVPAGGGAPTQVAESGT